MQVLLRRVSQRLVQVKGKPVRRRGCWLGKHTDSPSRPLSLSPSLSLSLTHTHTFWTGEGGACDYAVCVQWGQTTDLLPSY